MKIALSAFFSKTASVAAIVTIGLSQSVLADDAVVQVDSLQVKERIQSMEQINVSAPTEQIAEAPSTDAVAQLLEEMRQLDEQDVEQ